MIPRTTSVDPGRGDSRPGGPTSRARPDRPPDGPAGTARARPSGTCSGGRRPRAIRRGAVRGTSPSTGRDRPVRATPRHARWGAGSRPKPPSPAGRARRIGRGATTSRVSRAGGGRRPSSACDRGSDRRSATAPQSPERISTQSSSRRRGAARSVPTSSASYRTPVYRRIAGIVGAERAVRFAWVTAASATPFTPSSGSREAALPRIARARASSASRRRSSRSQGHRPGRPRGPVAARLLALGRRQQDQREGRGHASVTADRRPRRGGSARSRSRARRPRVSRRRAAAPRAA